MAIKLGNNSINKAYLGTTEIQKMYLGSELVFDNSVTPPVGLTPIMINFRRDNTNKNRVYFETPLGPVTGLTINGFFMTGETITAVNTVDNYFTVDRDLDYYTNSTIRLGDIDNIINNGIVYDFGHQYIDYGDIVRPTSGNEKFVEAGASGSGDNIGDPASLTTAFNTCSAGDHWNIKAGTYDTNYSVSNKNGNYDNPIVFEGYDNTPGDSPSHTFTPGITLDGSIMPLIPGRVGNGLQFSSCSFIHLLNFEAKDHANSDQARGISFIDCESSLMDNCYADGSTRGLGTDINDVGKNNKFIGLFTQDCQSSGVQVTGERALIESCYACTSYEAHQDYFYSVKGVGWSEGEHIIRNCEVDRFPGDPASDHTGHGFSIRGEVQTSKPLSNCLIENGIITDCRSSLECRGGASSYHTYRNILIQEKDSNSLVKFGNMSAGHHSTFDNIRVIGGEGAVSFLASTEDENATDAGSYHLYKNCIWDGVERCVEESGDTFGLDRTPKGNRFVNCTFNNASNFMNYEARVVTKGTGYVMSNCIINNVPSEVLNNGPRTGWTDQYTDFWNYWGANGSAPSGTGNLSVNPDLDSSYVPQADFSTIARQKYPDVNYDANESERANTTTPGPIKSVDEAGVTPPTPGGDVYPQDNVASNNPEGNALGALNVSNAVTLTIDTVDPKQGSYCAKGVATDTTSLYNFEFPTQAGKSYEVKIWAKTGTVINTQQFRLWQNINETVITMITSSTWTEYTHTVTPQVGGDPIQCRIYCGRTTGNIGDEVYADQITVIES